jgi:hypothetical protein
MAHNLDSDELSPSPNSFLLHLLEKKSYNAGLINNNPSLRSDNDRLPVLWHLEMLRKPEKQNM